jgi:prevent-host-death family protein
MSIPERRIHSDEARRRFRDLLDEVEHGGAHVTVMRYDTPAVVVVPVDWYRNANAVYKGVYAFTHDTDGGMLPDDSELPIGELHSAIGEAALAEIKKAAAPEITQTPQEKP